MNATSIDNLQRKRRGWVKKIGRRALHLTDRFIASQSLIGDTPVFENTIFPWTADFEANWEKIRKELDGVLVDRDSLPSFHDISPDQKRISKGDNWKTFIF
jgi:beta-hydroxylase